jgi:tetratricopeptide (TPR) repeat protein
MGKRTRKERGKARAGDSPAGAPRPGPSSPSPSPGRTRRGLFVLIGFIVIGVTAAAVVLTLNKHDARKVLPATPNTPPPLKIRELPSLRITDRHEFSVPKDLPESQQELANAALDAYEKAVEVYGQSDPATFVNLAQKARTLFERARWLPSELAPFHNLYVSLLFDSGQATRALDETEAWLKRYPRSLHHRDLLGSLYRRQGRFELAAQHFEVVAKAYPNSLVTQRRLAQIYSYLGAKDKALVAVDRSLRLIGFQPGRYPRHQSSAETLPVCLQVSHRFLEYKRLAEIAAVVFGKDAKNLNALMALGVAEQNLGRYDEAIEHLREYLKKVPDSSANVQLIELDLGIALIKRNQPRQASEALVSLLTKDPYNSKAYLHLGQALVRLGRPERARQFLEWTHKLAVAERETRHQAKYRNAGQTARADRSLAYSHRLRGEYAAAERVLRNALRPGDVAHSMYYIEQLVETARAVEALAHVEKLGEHVGATHQVARGWKGAALALKGDFAPAAELFEAASKEGGEALQVWGPHLVRLLLDTAGDASRARHWAKALLELGPEPGFEVLLARSHFDAGELEEAWKILNAMLTGTPGWRNEHGALWLARVRARLGRDLESAGRDLEKLASSVAHLPEFHLARAEWLEAGGGESSQQNRQEDIRTARARALKLKALRETYRATRQKACGSASGSARAALLLDAARVLFQMDDRDGALREAKLAVFASPRETPALELLEFWLDRPDEIFVRTKVQSQLRALDGTRGQPPTVAELVERLLAPEEDEES